MVFYYINNSLWSKPDKRGQAEPFVLVSGVVVVVSVDVDVAGILILHFQYRDLTSRNDLTS